MTDKHLESLKRITAANRLKINKHARKLLIKAGLEPFPGQLHILQLVDWVVEKEELVLPDSLQETLEVFDDLRSDPVKVCRILEKYLQPLLQDPKEQAMEIMAATTDWLIEELGIR
jgi:hypothetical protein